MRRLVLAAWIMSVLAVPAHAQVQVNVGIHLPGPPTLAVVPGAPVYYAPRAPANVFFYGSQYWVFHGNGWFIGPTWNGPWAVVAPMHVPVPILRVPVRYYHVPPGHWKQWERARAPHWKEEWGPEWADKRAWKERDRDRGRDDDHPGHGKGRGKGHGKD